MATTRRTFLGSASAAGVAIGLGARQPQPEAAMVREPRQGAAGPLAEGGRAGGRQARAGSPDDPLAVRRDFPIVEEINYLNSAYITPSPVQVVEAGTGFLEAKARNPIVLGEMLEETNAMRRKFARLIGASEAEVGVLYATSDGENVVTRALDLGPGDNVVIDDLHYETTFVLYRHLEATRGIELRIVPNRGGAAPAEEFARFVDDRTGIVSVAWVSHQNGYRHDLRALADVAHAHGAYLYADAIQGTGMLSLDVRETGVDFLASGTYKWLLGGFGVAPFYVRRELLDLVEVDRMGSLNIARTLPDFRFELYEDARKYGYATMSFGAVYQLSAALDYLLDVGVDNIERHTVALANRLHAGLVDQGFRVLTPEGNRSAIVAFEHGQDPETVRRGMEQAGILASLREEGMQIRVGAALFNNAQEIDRFLELAVRWA